MRPVPVPRSSRLPDRLRADGVEDRGLDRVLGGVQRAQPVPVRRQALRRRPAPRRARSPAPRRGARGRRRAGGRCRSSGGQDGAQDLGRGGALAEAEEGPGAFAVPLDEPGLGQELEMARDARLRLAEDIGQVGHRELALGKQRQHPQPGFLGGGPQSLQGLGQSGGRVVHGCPVRERDINISLCEIERKRRIAAKAGFHRPCGGAPHPGRRGNGRDDDADEDAAKARS